ncbi:TAP-like protein-domain-containing protein [Clohesyomyces aquaticus]|uniref:TAP-like protein-domain-containing protein n=1 Tax=Clohesyomyces aquaticus TaxID=1231657 RepID=A0A1Y1ZE14_9PLEO|nr:TAP-like protein-domain-containing protein [Clohesyomyces aquaticus]
MKGGPDTEQAFSRPSSRRRQLLVTGALASALILSLHPDAPSLSRLFPWSNRQDGFTTPSSDFQWSAIEATEQLEFHPCYYGFECAKLKLPLDYFNGTHPGETISLAIAKLPAKVPVTDSRYGGPVLINPGGPGGSGVGLALLEAQAIQTIIDPANSPASFHSSDRYYDIIGFDPRGIGLTEPAATCLDDDAQWSWMLREYSEGILGSSDASLGRRWSMTHAYGSACKQVMEKEDGSNIKQYMSTASVARDMLELAEKHAEYVKSHQSCKHELQDSTAKEESVKLQYWGFSYGTYLGSTFASMFPDRVGRLVLDGVVNSDDYNESLGNGSLHDAEKVMDLFYSYCVNVGPEQCRLAKSTSTVSDVKERVTTILNSLYHNPLPITTPSGPEVFSYSDLKGLAFTSLYLPAYMFPFLADIFAAVESGSGNVLDMLANVFRPAHIYQCPLNSSAPALPILSDVPEISILCSDGNDQSKENISAFESYWHELENTSPTSGSIWSILRMKCAAWKIRAVYRYTGAFGGETSHPILWIGNTADPVTPLRSARIMHGRFPGSGLLTQDSAGHCSSAVPTLCTVKAIRKYFQTGALPPKTQSASRHPLPSRSILHPLRLRSSTAS